MRLQHGHLLKINFAGLLLVMLCHFFPSKAQQKFNTRSYLNKGLEYYEAGDINKAIDAFTVVLENDNSSSEANYFQGKCLMDQWRFESAITYFDRISNAAAKDFPLTAFYLAQCQKTTGNLQDALLSFMQFLDDRPAVHQDYFVIANHEKNGVLMALDHSVNNSITITRLPAPLNSEGCEYGAIRPDSTQLLLIKRDQSGTNRLVSYRYKMGKWWLQMLPYNQIRNYYTLDIDAGQINHDNTGYYFTARARKSKYFQLYENELESDRFLPPVFLGGKINDLSSNNMYPTVNLTEDTLYFSSDRAGGYGGFDLWYSIKDEKGQWSEPENMGQIINSEKDEITPHFSYEDKALFFSSNGHIGYGHFDIYYCNKPHTSGEIHNMGAPFNSGYDDKFLIITNGEGFFSSNRDGADEDLDVYRFFIDESQNKPESTALKK